MERGERPVWFGGGRLDRNLTLPALRSGWEDSPQAAAEGAEEWRRANRAWRTSVPVPGADGARSRPTGRGRPDRRPGVPQVPGPGRALPQDAAGAVAAVNARLAAVAVSDRVAWRHAAREAAGVFATFSLQVEGSRPGALARASDALARSAQPVRGEQPDQSAMAPAAGTGMGGRHLNLMVRASSRRRAEGWIAVLRQLDRTTQAVHDAHAARGEAIRARQIAAEAGHGLARVREQLATTQAATAPTSRPGARGPELAGAGRAGAGRTGAARRRRRERPGCTTRCAPAYVPGTPDVRHARDLADLGRRNRTAPDESATENRRRPPAGQWTRTLAHDRRQGTGSRARVAGHGVRHAPATPEGERKMAEGDEVGEELDRVLRVTLTAAGQLGEAAARRNADRQREAANASQGQGAALQQEMTAQRDGARVVSRQAADSRFWDSASARDVGQV